MNFLTKTIDGVLRLCLIAAAAALVAISVLVALSAIMRYVVSTPFAFTEELVGLVMTAMLFITLPAVLWRSKHIRMTLVATRITGWPGAIVALFSAAILMIFAGWFLLESWQSLGFELRFNTRTNVAELLIYPWVALIPISMGMLLLISALRLPHWFSNGRHGKTDHQKDS